MCRPHSGAIRMRALLGLEAREEKNVGGQLPYGVQTFPSLR